jgi:hypothetical protein
MGSLSYGRLPVPCTLLDLDRCRVSQPRNTVSSSFKVDSSTRTNGDYGLTLTFSSKNGWLHCCEWCWQGPAYGAVILARLYGAVNLAQLETEKVLTYSLNAES